MFPFLSIHYKEILYGAYKSDDPQLYIKEILDTYEIRASHLKFLIKYIWNRDIYADTDIMKTIKREESNSDTVHGTTLGRFIYYATSLCHIWYSNSDLSSPELDPSFTGNIICYESTNEPLPYMWFDFDTSTNELTLVRANTQFLHLFRVQLKMNDSRRNFLFNLESGDRYICRSTKNYCIIHLEKNTHNSYISAESETGILTQYPFSIVVTHSSVHSRYQLCSVFYNNKKGHIRYLPISLHPVKEKEEN